MQLEIRDLTGYFDRPPKIGEIAGNTLDQRRERRGEILVIVPAYHDNARLASMFMALWKQEGVEFDVLAVYGTEDEFVPSGKLSVIHVNRKEELGFAGAVYLGQKIAKRDGYKYYIATDVDRQPYGNWAVKSLYDEAERGGYDYVAGGQVGVGRSPSHFLFGLVRASTLEKCGYFPLPLYLGLEEGEYHHRLLKYGAKFRLLSTPVSVNVMRAEEYQTLEHKLLKLLHNGGADSLYYNSDMIGNWLMPQIFFDPVLVPPEDRKSLARWAGGVLSYLEYASRRFFSHSLQRRLMELRIPETKIYAKRARERRFSSYIWKLDGSPCRVEWHARGKGPPKAAAGLGGIVSAISKNETALAVIDYYVLMYDKCMVYDEREGKLATVEWNGRLSAMEKMLVVLLSFVDVAALLLAGTISMLHGNEMFAGYGIGRGRRAA